MTLYTLIRNLYFLEGNAKCNIDVVTNEVAEEFGNTYKGHKVRYGGLSGRLGDVPIYLAKCEVRSWVTTPDGGHKITI